MGLIIGSKIKQLIKGYPTVSDKYDVEGGINAGPDALEFGAPIYYTGTSGYYTGTYAAGKFAGICLATNVKLVQPYGAGSSATAKTEKGEAFNVCVRGFVAVEVKGTETELKTPGTLVKVGTDGFEVTTVAADAIAKLTGICEDYADGKGLAEIRFNI